MATPSIRPIRNCLYGWMYKATQLSACVASARWRAGEHSCSGGVRSVARPALTLLNAPLVRCSVILYVRVHTEPNGETRKRSVHMCLENIVAFYFIIS